MHSAAALLGDPLPAGHYLIILTGEHSTDFAGQSATPLYGAAPEEDEDEDYASAEEGWGPDAE